MTGDPQKRPLVSYSYGSATSVPAVEAPPSKPATRQPFIFNGEELDVERLPWRVWSQMRAEFGHVPGWTFCRFGCRVRGETENMTVQRFGIASGLFGIYRNHYLICGRDEIVGQLSVLVHLPSGSCVGLFTDDDEAITAAACCDRALWGFDVPSTETVTPAFTAAQAAWKNAGLDVLMIHAHDIDGPEQGPPASIWAFDREPPKKGRMS